MIRKSLINVHLYSSPNGNRNGFSSSTMSKLVVSFLNRHSCKDCGQQLERDVVNVLLYLCVGWGVYPTLEPYPIICLLINILFVFVSWQVRNFTCKPCILECRDDIIKVCIFTLVAEIIYPYIKCNELAWWTLHAVFAACMKNIIYLIIHNKSPFVVMLLAILMKLLVEATQETFMSFHTFNIGKKLNMCHYHTEYLCEDDQDTFTSKESKKTDVKVREIELKKTSFKENVDNFCMEKKRNKTHVLNVTLTDLQNRMNQWEQTFETWNSSTDKEKKKLKSDEIKLNAEISSFCKERKKIRDDMAKYKLNNRELTKKILEKEANKNKLLQMRRKIEVKREEKLYDFKLEKAKLQRAIQKIKEELDKDDSEYGSGKKAEKTLATTDTKVDTTNTLMKKIEELETDLECPVCFEVCSKPIYMCNFQHQICKSCRPKMTQCPQCREPYKKHRIRNREMEVMNNKLQELYKELKTHLEKN